LLLATFSGASAPLAVASPSAEAVGVKVSNPLKAARASETVVLALPELAAIAKLDPARTVVVDAAGKPVMSQLVDLDGDEVPEQLVFQTDLGPLETRTFTVQAGARTTPASADFRVYGRFVRERHDDFAWENDRIAHRMYGPDLETWKKEPLTSSGVDVWTKRTRRLVVNDWYLTDDYHRDAGEGGDFYSVGKSRGCGGLGIWSGDKLAASRNFTVSRVLANGPLRLVFELDYAPWEAGGVRIGETKRVIVDAGRSFDRFESTFRVDGKPAEHAPLSVAIGIAKHEGGTAEVDRKTGWLRSWEPLKEKGKVDVGHLGCGVVVPPAAVADYKQTTSDFLLVARAQAGAPFAYLAGFGWDRSGDVADADAWKREVDRAARELAAPVRVTLGPATPTPTKAAEASPPAAPSAAPASPGAWAARTCDSVMKRAPVLTERWTYDAGLVLKGCEAVGRETGDARYADYVARAIDHLVDGDGNIKGYHVGDYVLDDVNMGKVLFALYARAPDARAKERYKRALQGLRAQLRAQPRTADGGFWHKNIYPHQMWLDGVYMASPFLAEYASVFDDPSALDDAARQVLLAEKHLREPRSGLLFHGWDESKAERWADPKTGTSSQFWGRGMGWYAMGVVDVLEWMPPKHPRRPEVLAVLRRLAEAIASVQDKETGVWWQVLDAPGRDKNFLEASASSMFVYALTKGVRNGWLDARTYGPVAQRGYQGIVDRFAEVGADGQVKVKSICKVAGLGGNPYRDGSYAYYAGTEVVADDHKGVGAFILAGAERERARAGHPGVRASR
jgi:unsaturated rhamnogalacturonyl hydrolase